jgi:hypothetical protein
VCHGNLTFPFIEFLVDIARKFSFTVRRHELTKQARGKHRGQQKESEHDKLLHNAVGGPRRQARNYVPRPGLSGGGRGMPGRRA